MSDIKAALMATFYVGLIVLLFFASITGSLTLAWIAFALVIMAAWRFLFMVFKS